jgi:hypothetical protein
MVSDSMNARDSSRGAADLAFGFGLTGDALNSAAGRGALTDTRADGGEADCQASSHNGSGGGDGIHVGWCKGKRWEALYGMDLGIGSPRAGTFPKERARVQCRTCARMCLADRRSQAIEKVGF